MSPTSQDCKNLKIEVQIQQLFIFDDMGGHLQEAFKIIEEKTKTTAIPWCWPDSPDSPSYIKIQIPRITYVRTSPVKAEESSSFVSLAIDGAVHALVTAVVGAATGGMGVIAKSLVQIVANAGLKQASKEGKWYPSLTFVAADVLNEFLKEQETLVTSIKQGVKERTCQTTISVGAFVHFVCRGFGALYATATMGRVLSERGKFMASLPPSTEKVIWSGDLVGDVQSVALRVPTFGAMDALCSTTVEEFQGTRYVPAPETRSFHFVSMNEKETQTILPGEVSSNLSGVNGVRYRYLNAILPAARAYRFAIGSESNTDKKVGGTHNLGGRAIFPKEGPQEGELNLLSRIWTKELFSLVSKRSHEVFELSWSSPEMESLRKDLYPYVTIRDKTNMSARKLDADYVPNVFQNPEKKFLEEGLITQKDADLKKRVEKWIWCEEKESELDSWKTPYPKYLKHS